MDESVSIGKSGNTTKLRNNRNQIQLITTLMNDIPLGFGGNYRQTSNTGRTKSHNLNDSRLVL